ncbi:MFS transporter [Corynebacterium variabile]|uniref:MFS transporter n=1 Tax=Corynebacterium variabile TaxID=1727 RepID=UPI003FCF0787
MKTSTNPSLGPRITTVLLLSSVLPLIDSSLVNVLLPAIRHEFGAPESSLQLGVSGYMLAATAGIVVSTTCMRRYSARNVWIASVLGFGLSSALVGFSGTLSIFIVARVLQGAACGFIMPAVQQIAADLVGRQGMRAALATIGLPAVIAPAFGPLLGGFLVDAVGWRVLFLINVPFAIIALLLARDVLPSGTVTRTPLALGQAIPGVLGMVGLLWAVSSLGTESTGMILLIAAVAVVLLIVFCVTDLRSSAPVLDVSLYRKRPFATVMLLCLIVGAVFYGTLLSTSLQVQGDLGQSAWVAGTLLGVQGLGAWASRSLIKGPWKNADAFTVIGSGLLIAAAGTLGVQSVGSWGMGTGTLAMVSCLVRGLGLGACTLLALSAAYEVVEDTQAPAVGAHTRLMLQIGGVFGTALVGVWTASAVSLGFMVGSVALIGATAAGGLSLLRYRTINGHG